MNTLKPYPSVRFLCAERLAKSIRLLRADGVETREIRLDNSVITSRLKRFGALRKRSSDVVTLHSCGDSNCMREHVSTRTHVSVELPELIERAHGQSYFSTGRDGSNARLIAVELRRCSRACLV